MRTAGLLLALGLAALPTLLRADPYLLNPQDQLTLRAAFWKADEGLYLAWDGINGTYRISPEGDLHLPLIGQVPAADQSIATLARDISLRLQQKVGTGNPPEISLEVSTYAPIYILGAVTAPGAYPYQPGMTVQQAIALAGGVLRPAAGVAAGAPDRAATYGGEVKMASDALAQLRQTKAWLEAELADLSAPAADAQRTTDETPLEPVGAALFAANRASRGAQTESLGELRNVLTEQIQRFEQQISLRDSQIAQISADLGGMEQLRDQGLAANARVTALSTQLSDLESKRLDLENARLVAEQQLNQATRDELNVTEQARTDFLAQLRQVNGEILANETRLATATALYSSAVSAGAMPVPGIDPLVPEYVVTPRTPDQEQRLFQPTELLPAGSTLNVMMKVNEAATPLAGGK